ncbi:ABC transporter permease subunit [Paenibacillus sp. FSL W8-1187]|uniref:Pyrimidine ABC transporter, transmembrane component 2 n=1 Tax=Paenibacillus pasadenensis TaxID=217090 RepID=A0A2N5N6Q9_9BACL|nr:MULTISPECIES: ABC transporter permease subunit [Paenibacillus]PLT46037.1 Pyrimidine ABC transporter, transmembrane component 2 [Paenibacillus pasadenensis]QGG56519.1 ABC transporter permease subunit [Paenibacillus sp. B01]
MTPGADIEPKSATRSGASVSAAAAALEAAIPEAPTPSRQARPRAKRRLGSRSAASRLPELLLPLAAGLAVLALWQAELFHALLGLRTYQLPLPSAIAAAAAANAELLLRSAGVTLAEAWLGLAAGSLLGWLAAAAAVLRPALGRGALLLAAALSAVPIVALAPLFSLWLGDGIASRAGVAAVASLAPMALGSWRGLTSPSPAELDLMRSLGASKAAEFRKLRLPSSLPYTLTALKINAAASLIAAIVSEFFFASRGLGYLLSNSVKIARMPLGWACIAVAAAAGIASYGLLQLAERRLLHGRPDGADSKQAR